ncbi:hypothetical protein ACTI_42400 [Actinoplanes sp. OR16]|uniref:hypothetical protein n=1 Tax=Actinoplanes sp. OR16 TaxID=946334 RepID=UPI000F6C08D5|nr:hypothetical protein [Actinoplanes sp. OR16]BBH67555.1 hypothetical protein ACTI_42400 [Actinoplanes sp. OR16]
MTDLDQQLRALDAALPITAEQRTRAQSTLERIVAGPPLSLSPRPRRLRIPRWAGLAAVAAAAVVAGAMIVIPGTFGGRAYASWTPVPAPLSGAEIALIGPACMDGFGESPRFDRSEVPPALAERRGEYAMLLYRFENPATAASCLVHNIPGSDDVDDLTWGLGSGSDTAWTLPPSSFTEGAIFDFRKASVIEGTAGDGVTGVTVHAGDITAEATVSGGRYVVWWPGPAFTYDADDDPVLDLTYDLTLGDGRVVVGAQPYRPR